MAAGDDRDSRFVGSMSGLGRNWNLAVQFMATIVMLGAGGWWLDSKLGTDPWLLLLGLGVGFSIGIYHFYREGTSDERSG